MDIKIITGLSGAGKSTVIHKLEDMGYYCIDNLPPQFLEQFVELCSAPNSKIKKLAIVIDIRGEQFFSELKIILKNFMSVHKNCSMIYLEASNDTLIKRYKETRRMHPLSRDTNIIDGIEKERELTYFLRRNADYIIDTGDMSTRKLENKLIDLFDKNKIDTKMKVTFVSFGYKYGIPLQSDIVFDVRFMDNPYYVKELKPLTGEDKKVIDYVKGQDKFETFYDKSTDLLEFLFKQYSNEPRNAVVVAIGCTGGKHRSVVVARSLYEYFSSVKLKKEYDINIEHRDKHK